MSANTMNMPERTAFERLIAAVQAIPPIPTALVAHRRREVAAQILAMA